MATDDFVLYLLVRDDMQSLRHTGRVIAQGAHAANHAAESIARNEFGPEVMVQFSQWQKQTLQWFGTTVVLGGAHVTIGDIRKLVDCCGKLGIAAAVINDPSYSLKDGNTTHLFPCDTCAWVFVDRGRSNVLLSKFSLYPNMTY